VRAQIILLHANEHCRECSMIICVSGGGFCLTVSWT